MSSLYIKPGTRFLSQRAGSDCASKNSSKARFVSRFLHSCSFVWPMGSAEIVPVRRGRKRKVRNGSEGSVVAQATPQTKKRAAETRSKELVGRYAMKEFVGSGIFLGIVAHYNSGLYRIIYEDGDFEDLKANEIRGFLVPDGNFNDVLMPRKKRLDEFLLNKDARKTTISGAGTVNLSPAPEGAEEFSLSGISCGPRYETGGDHARGSADSSSDSSVYVKDDDLSNNAEILVVPPPQLPSSSSSIGIPMEYVSHLFSVYCFLRSFSIRLFLRPFGLNDLVGSLNCVVPNNLLDAIHVALLRALRRHLEILSSDGSAPALKCLRIIDWSLLDTLTWPVYVVYYLNAMRYTETPEWKIFYTDVLNKGYFSLPPGRKLLVLQILCDDVLNSPELRAEIDMREVSEFGIDSDEPTTDHPENGFERFHPRFQKASACNGRDAIYFVSGCQKSSWSCGSNPLGPKCLELDNNIADVERDGNGNECCLCGMDGTLLCCDGCPSAYHSRCIGVSKLSIPEGSWFCPECTCNMTELAITKETSLRAADIFGIDPYGQVFLGTCNHLLILNASFHRYYNQGDIPKVLEALYLSVQNRSLYLGICKAIIKYWEMAEDILKCWEIPEVVPSYTEMVELLMNTELPSPSDKEAHTVFNVDDRWNDECGFKVGIMATAFPGPSFFDAQPEQYNMRSHQFTKEPPLNHQVVASGLACQVTSGNSNAGNGSKEANVNDISFSANMTSKIKETIFGVGDGVARNSMDVRPCLASLFRPQAYLNQYIYGDFAASAAANLAVLSSEENRASDAYAMAKSRKVMSAEILLQVKAFSSAANRFFWPTYEKKLADVPRERCGWCLSCRTSATCKKACLLNSAALSAIKGSMKILAGLHPIKNGEGSLSSILMYMLCMEESLSGLLSGPFLNASSRKQWCRGVEQASNCCTLKALLLDLEENIQVIALSGDWLKLEDCWFVDTSAAQNISCIAGSTKKHGRKSKRQLAVSEVDGGCTEKRTDFSWWRGGEVSKFVYQKGILPRKMIKKAAHQGSNKKIIGLYYSESSEVPKRSLETVWRAAVEMSQSVSQFALQVRYLDLHIRWSDLSRPEQNIQDGKGLETEASAFRNAFICDKRIVENMIRYGVAFGNQRHLPSRVLKSIIEVEKSEDGKAKYWFLETRVPLYLIKEYEEKASKLSLPSDGKSPTMLSLMQRKQLKASKRDAFAYLARKRENLGQCSCSSCQLGVLLGEAVKCSVCKGYCHLKCTISLVAQTRSAADSMITCEQCYFGSGFAQNADADESPTSPLPFLGPEYQSTSSSTATLIASQTSSSQLMAYSQTIEARSETKQEPYSQPMKKSKGICSWGLIWKKNKKENNDFNGFDFRCNNILLKGNTVDIWCKPSCHLCHRPYDSNLMYICCESCENWYHADAVGLEESKMLKLLGFKCCKCRRIKSPWCPYMGPVPRRSEGKKTRSKSLKGCLGVDSDYGPITEKPSGHLNGAALSKKNENSICSLILSSGEQYAEAKFESDSPSELQKLLVRRQVMGEGERDGYSEKGLPNLEGKPCAVMGLDGVEKGMEFEPQTYFSFTELMASKDGELLDEVDLSAVLHQRSLQESQVRVSGWEESLALVQVGDNAATCGICSGDEPPPDLACQICQVRLHARCLPWEELPSLDDGCWSCGLCLEWQ